MSIHPGLAGKDLFCRLYLQTDLPHGELVGLLGRCVGGTVHFNSVRSQELDISVDENDLYDPERSGKGNDRWLYFRYTLEITPSQSADSREYVAAISRLLSSLWSAGIDAVAASEFEEQLPTNVRRLNWQKDH
jgi:hypothetical protein